MEKLTPCCYRSLPAYGHQVFKCLGGIPDALEDYLYKFWPAQYPGCDFLVCYDYLGDRIAFDHPEAKETALIREELDALVSRGIGIGLCERTASFGIHKAPIEVVYRWVEGDR